MTNEEKIEILTYYLALVRIPDAKLKGAERGIMRQLEKDFSDMVAIEAPWCADLLTAFFALAAS